MFNAKIYTPPPHNWPFRGQFPKLLYPDTKHTTSLNSNYSFIARSVRGEGGKVHACPSIAQSRRSLCCALWLVFQRQLAEWLHAIRLWWRGHREWLKYCALIDNLALSIQRKRTAAYHRFDTFINIYKTPIDLAAVSVIFAAVPIMEITKKKFKHNSKST